MSKKREGESDVEYKARKKAKKALKKATKKALKKDKKASKKAAKKSKSDESSDGSMPETKEKSSSLSSAAAASSSSSISDEPPSWNSFSDAPFAEPIQEALRSAGFTEPSPIQSRAWPAAISGKDLIAVAKTGSGKTLGFLLPVFHRISTDDLPGGIDISRSSGAAAGGGVAAQPACLVLSPTRELAIQIHGECEKFASLIGIKAECVYGGTNVQSQSRQLKSSNPHVVIATPGRLCDLLERRDVLSLSNCPLCVLDEADRMLDMGFEKQLTTIMKVLPTERQTLFFTATWPKAVRRMASNYLRKGETTEVFIGGAGDGELAANTAVTQTFIEAQDDEKDKKLYDLLCGLDEGASVVIFANTKRRVDYVAKAFWQEGFATVAVHGDKPQHERDSSLKKFINKESNIMVATDVAARGLDIKGVTHVINFDMARDVESYVHRIGRTGRAGEVGHSVTFWNPDYDKDCSPALVVIARNAGQEIPAFLKKYEKVKTSKQWKVANAEKATAELLKGNA